LALYRATAFGEGHCSGVLTVAGDAVATPKNVRVPFGVSVEAILNHCGLSADPTYVILGDAMTGVTTPSLNVPILPGITCILALTSRPAPRSQPCIGCGRCAQVCHAGLLPYEIVRRLENMHYERLPSLFPTACDGCGACSHVCPSGREVCAHVTEAQQTPGSIFLNWGDDDDA
jgi:electron transport complex protein RnfC